MGEIFPDGDGTLSLCRLDVSWARRAADFDARVFGDTLAFPTTPRHCEGATRPKQSIPTQLLALQCQQYPSLIAASRTVSAPRNDGEETCNDGEKNTPRNDGNVISGDGVETAWPFEVWQEMLSNPDLSFFAYIRPAEGMQARGDIVALGGISSGNTPEILTLGVEQSYRGQGLGGKLLDLLIEQAEKNVHATHVTLEVRADNERALSLYTSRGFTPCVNRHRHPETSIRKAQLFLIKKL